MNERDQRIPDHFPDPLRREAQPAAVAIVSGVEPKKNTDDTGANSEIASDVCDPGRPDESDARRVAVPGGQTQQFDTLVSLGHSARRRGDRAASLAHFEAASAVDPAQVGVKLERANDLRELGRLDEAESLLRTVLEEHPQHVGAVVGLGHVLRRRGDRTGSLAQFRAAGAANPNDVEVQTEIATDLRELGHFDDAEVVLRAALQSQPQHFWALVGLGQLLRRRGDRTGSFAQYQAAAAVNPNEI
jgi:tetratricopeptide (TPR) repeat protein